MPDPRRFTSAALLASVLVVDGCGSDVPEGGVVDTLDLPTVTTGDDGDYLNVDLGRRTITTEDSLGEKGRSDLPVH
ncbi:hypothetical protein IFT73_13475 [Aeromicrobium sp. CFBP 8757]|uniref:hypothetical protein n=1 Tax=Aeromicrobium sp. CFBP 8757 TaxID=2775288 RepID=UPI001783EFE2|nr:hypothetical protein [Aeromicrobium sp. CFBP 8757]MBD8607867.1 hypothetical protein [Aeromicrobium sp. CFBP 8757]